MIECILSMVKISYQVFNLDLNLGFRLNPEMAQTLFTKSLLEVYRYFASLLNC